MTEVHRYKVVKMLSEGGNRISYDPHGPEVVVAEALDAALAREAVLQQRLATAEHQREQLAQAIADATHKAGIVAAGAALDGPTLLMVLSDLAECHLATQQRLSEADQRIAELRHVGLELSGTMAEYRQMPCKSLQDRMFATYDRYVKRLNPAL